MKSVVSVASYAEFMRTFDDKTPVGVIISHVFTISAKRKTQKHAVKLARKSSCESGVRKVKKIYLLGSKP